MIGIIGAMDIEVENIKAILDDQKEEIISGVKFVCGTYSGKDVVVAKCGVGKVFAAICTEAMIIRYRPEIIVNVGVGGSLCPNLRIGDIVVASDVVQHDMDTSPIGDPIGMLSDINMINIPSSKRVSEALVKGIEKAGLKYEMGTIASGDQFVADNAKKQFIVENFNAKACEMEGASIGQVCYVNDVEFGILRALSDEANGNANMDFPTFAKMAAENSTAVIKNFFELI